jgi:hypothetical protein
LVLILLAVCSVASAAPTIDELLPAAGFPWGGTPVIIQGSDLLQEAFSQLLIGALPDHGAFDNVREMWSLQPRRTSP